MVEGNAKFAVNNLFNVEGWVCVVSGGGTGIGLMIAQAFANNGARVYITGRRADALQQAAQTWGAKLVQPQGRLIPVTADITDKASVETLARTIGEREGRVDVLVNNAGISGSLSQVEKGDETAEGLQKELWKEDVQKWQEVYQTNVIGHFFTTVAFIPWLAAAGKARPGHTGSVINISSMSGITRSTQKQYMYNVSKAASIQLTDLLAQELRRPGVKVRVNGIAPGLFPSEMTTSGSDETQKSQIPVGDDFGAQKGIPAGRPGREEDLAQVAIAIACNEYMYGETVAVEGGWLLENP